MSEATAPALVIGGPTASGKSTLALALAQEIGGEIINADAFQLYEGLPLLTAQPTPLELAGAPHQLVSEFALDEHFDAARYLKIARERIAASWAAGRTPILVGGTGLYIRATLFGLTAGLPGPDANLRTKLEALPLEELQRQLAVLDPLAVQLIDLKNPRRVVRALEVCMLTGRPFTSFREPERADHPVAGIWLSLPREVLHQKIEARARQLFEAGVEDEVRAALPKVGQGARQAIGFEAISAVIEGKSSRDKALESIIFATRQYARRQETWFRKEPYLLPQAPEAARSFCLELLHQKAKGTNRGNLGKR
jgi:tRNA dimethylallyltransferase